MATLKTSMVAAVALLVSATATQARSQQPTLPGPRPGVRASVGARRLAPIGGFRNGNDGGYGAFAQVAIPVMGNKVLVTGSNGVNTLYARENGEGQPISPDLTLMPAKVGIQFFPIDGLYVQAEAGASFLTRKAGLTNARTAALTVAPQIGYLRPVGRHGSLDAGVRFEHGSRLSNEVGNARPVGRKPGYAYAF